MAKNGWETDWQVGIRVWVERQGQAVLGEGRAELLAAIDREQSITKAAKAVGMSYRRAWNLIQEANDAAGEPLVAAAVGGKSGGGARLTARGRLAVDVYEQVRESLVESAANILRGRISSGAPALPCIHLAAAISLQEAVGQILAEYALREPQIRVRAIFGASNELVDHLVAGAPGDIFITADPVDLDRLAAKLPLILKSRRMIAQNGLAIVGPQNVARLKKPADLLKNRFKKVALAESACPLGQHSQTYLQDASVFDELLPKVLYVDNSRAVLAAIVSGAAGAGVAFSSDAASGVAWRTLLRIPSAETAATYAAAVIRRGQQNEAEKLLDFICSQPAARCLRRCGLRPIKAHGTPR